jgi:hypothetical protein
MVVGNVLQSVGNALDKIVLLDDRHNRLTIGKNVGVRAMAHRLIIETQMHDT